MHKNCFKVMVNVVLGLSLLGSTIYAEGKGLVGHWTLAQKDEVEGKANDSTPNANHGTVSFNRRYTTNQKGESNAAIKFHGNSKISTTLRAKDIPSDKFTISVWAKPNTLKGKPVGVQDIVSTFNHVGGGNPSTGMTFGKDYYDTFFSTNLFDGKGHSTVLKYPDWEVEQWYHIVLVFDGGNYALLYFGDEEGAELVDRNDHPISSVYNEYPFNIGKSEGRASGSFDGEISDVRIYNRALSEDEVKTLYLEGCPTP